jgi:high-affinity K+ transport system ATPase subunit B
MLNVMALHSPASAILSAVIFNALVIVFLIHFSSPYTRPDSVSSRSIALMPINGTTKPPTP